MMKTVARLTLLAVVVASFSLMFGGKKGDTYPWRYDNGSGYTDCSTVDWC